MSCGTPSCTRSAMSITKQDGHTRPGPGLTTTEYIDEDIEATSTSQSLTTTGDGGLQQRGVETSNYTRVVAIVMARVFDYHSRLPLYLPTYLPTYLPGLHIGLTVYLNCLDCPSGRLTASLWDSTKMRVCCRTIPGRRQTSGGVRVHSSAEIPEETTKTYQLLR